MSRFLDMLALVAPQAAVRRRQAQLMLDQMRGYDAAQTGRRTSSFRRGAGSANAEISRALPALRERSRELCRNTFIGPRVLDILATQVIGVDLNIRFTSTSADWNARAQALWNEWIADCDIEEESNFNGLLSLAFRAMIEGGDSIIRLVDLPLNATSGVPLRLHVGEGDMIDETRDAASLRPEGRRARLGVELGENDRRIGYWLHEQPPGEPARNLSATTSRLVPRDEVIHLFQRLRPGQVRGVPKFAPILMTARDYADFLDSVTLKAKAEANVALIVKSLDGTASIGERAQGRQSGEPPVTDLRPGAIHRLKAGEDAVPFTPSSNTAFDPVSRANLMAIAAACGITYDQLTGDLTQANYSSMRAGTIPQRRVISDMQWNTLEPQAIRRIVARFLVRAELAGRLPPPPRRSAQLWQVVMPAFEAIDPKKDLEADILAVRSGRLSPQDFIEAWGRPWREVMAEYDAFITEADNAGRIFDIDARQRTRVGQPTEQQAAPAADE